MRISEFVHGITNPELIKRLHDKILKKVNEMMRVTTSFLRGKWQPRITNERNRFHYGNNKRVPRGKILRKEDSRTSKEINRRNAQGRKAFAPNKGAQTEQWKGTTQDGEERRNHWEGQSISHPNGPTLGKGG
ncbi:hypothetical protein Tco_0760299 [Tanacetum coccineum]